MTVSLSSGVVRGTSIGGVNRYLGIPYASTRRFELPQPVEPWGELDATTFGPTVPQAPYEGVTGTLLSTVEVPGDEWLNLNVWAPAAAQGAPVILWIHGGSFAHGSNALSVYDGTAFARDGVVFVSINYRVAAEGFSVLADAPRNLGIADQFAALEWVQREIAAFGGDPSRVTVMGESAGGNAVAVLLAHPRASSLFSRAIIQSGPLTAQAVKSAGRITKLTAKKLGIAATREAFTRQSPQSLVEATSAVTAGSTPITGGPGFAPVVDGEFVPAEPQAALRGGAGAGIPLLIGSTTDEYRLWFVPTGLVDRVTRVQLLAAQALFRIRSSTIRVYRANRPGASIGHIFGALATDLLLRIPLNRLADARLARGAQTHVYEFAWPSPVLDLGAAHAMELGFVFDTLTQPDAIALGGPDAPQSLADEMHAAWVAFATTGDPGWEVWSSARPVRVFDADGGRTVNAPRDDERAAWTS